MLTLAQASAYFDRTELRDPDTNALLFLGQIDPFDDSRRDAGGAYRRILSVAPGVTMPASRAMRAHGQVWLAGTQEIDGLQSVHRHKYVLQEAPVKYSISRLPGFLTATVASAAWAAVEWAKDGKQLEVSSRPVPVYSAHFATGVDLREYDVVWSGADAYLVTSVHQQASGFLGATLQQLEFAVVSASVSARTYDPVAGAYTVAAPVAVQALRVRWQSLYMYGSEADARYQEGDCSIALPAGTVITTADTLTLGAQAWRAASVDELGGAVVVHGRPS